MPEDNSSFNSSLLPVIRSTDHRAAESAIQQVFSQDFAFLRPFYLPTWPIFKRLQQSNIIESKWLETEVESFLNESDRGFLILEGQGGIGKTTFLAQWVYKRGSIHHFIELAPGFKGAQIARCSLGAQIIRVFGMADFMPLNRFQEAIHFPDFLQILLAESSLRNKQSNPNRKIIIILDGLEEVGVMVDQNPFGLPEILPENVYFIISQPPHIRKHKTKGLVKTIHLGNESPSHLSDLRAYSMRTFESASYESIKKRIKPDLLSEILLGKSKGSWICLIHLLRQLRDIEVTALSEEELQTQLPECLMQSYLQAFLRLKDLDQAEWYRFILPILGVLAAYPEPVTVPQLATYASLPADYRFLNNYLDHSLQSFISTDFQERYRFNHLSLKELFSGTLENGNISLQEEAFLYEMVENSRLFHLRIATEILSWWGGLEEGLPDLQIRRTLTSLDEYGLDYLVTHLEGSGSTSDLKRLLNMDWQIDKGERSQPARFFPLARKRIEKKASEKLDVSTNGWYTTKRSQDRLLSYLEDIKKVWNLSSTVGEQVRYALITTSVLTMASQTSDSFTIGDQEEQDQAIASMAACLAKAGDPSGALNAVDMIRKTRWKSQAFADISNHLPSQSIPTVLRYCNDLDDTWGQVQIITNCALRLNDLSRPAQAIEIARQIPVDSHRNQLLGILSTKLIEANQVELALEAVHNIKDENIQVNLLIDFGKNLDRESLQVALTIVRAFHNNAQKAQALTGLAPYLPNALMRDSLHWLQQIGNEESRSQALVGLIPHIREPMLKDALAAAREIKDERLRAPVLVELTIRTATQGDPIKALQLIHAILGENHKASAITGIAPYLKEEQRYEALGIGQKFKDGASQVRAQEGLVPYLYEPVLQDILLKAHRLKNEVWQETIFRALIKRYSELGEPSKSIEIIQQCASQEQRARLLVDLVPLLPDEMRKEALEIALDISTPSFQAKALAGLAPYLSESDLLEALSSTLKLTNQGWLGANLRSETLVTIISLLAERGDLERSLNALQEIYDDDGLVQALGKLIPHLSGEFQNAALAAVQRIQDPNKRALILTGLVPMLPPLLVEDALAYLNDFSDEKTRVKVIVGLAPSISAENLHTFLVIVRGINDKNLRVQALAAAVQNWLLIPKPQSLSLWKETILDLSNQSRPDLLSDLQPLAPLIYDLGGIGAIKETLQAIRDVVRWWN